MGPRDGNRVFRFKGVRPLDVGLMDSYQGVISFIVPQRIGLNDRDCISETVYLLPPISCG